MCIFYDFCCELLQQKIKDVKKKKIKFNMISFLKYFISRTSEIIMTAEESI